MCTVLHLRAQNVKNHVHSASLKSSKCQLMYNRMQKLQLM